MTFNKGNVVELLNCISRVSHSASSLLMWDAVRQSFLPVGLQPLTTAIKLWVKIDTFGFCHIYTTLNVERDRLKVSKSRCSNMDQAVISKQLCHSVDLLDVAVALVIILCIFLCIYVHLLLRPSRLEADSICTFTCKLCNEIEVQSNLILQHPSFYIYITSDDGYVCLCCQTGRSSNVHSKSEHSSHMNVLYSRLLGAAVFKLFTKRINVIITDLDL